jgi:hypothetical protein
MTAAHCTKFLHAAMNHGNEITAEQIEMVFGLNGASGRFANFCNAAIVAEGTSAISRFPVLSEKPGADGCFDGEWNIELREGELLENPFAKAGWNIFQFKARGTQGGGRRKSVSAIKGSLKGSISELVGRLKHIKEPSQYVLFTNLQLGLENESKTSNEAVLSQDRENLKKAILEDYAPDISIQIVDACLLAALSNKHPALRLTYFAQPIARSWDEKWEEERHAKDYKASVSLIGREPELEMIGRLIADGTTKVIALSGPPGIGKTRLALESTRNNRWRTSVVDVVEEFQRWPLSAFSTSIQPQIILVEDPDEKQAENLAKQAVASTGVKLIFTFPSEADAPKLKLTEHDAVKKFSLRPLSNEQSKKLLADAGASFDTNALDWILLQAGGNPDILLSVAEIGQDLRKRSDSLKSALAGLYQKRIERSLGSEAFTVLRLVSPLQWTKVSGEKNNLEALTASFKTHLSPAIILDLLKRLEVMGYVRRRGDYVMVVPPLFAAALAEELHKEQADVVCALFDRLDDSSQKRLLERVVTTDLEEGSKFWNHVFGGDVGTISRLTVSLELLGYMARAVPGRTARFLASQINELGEYSYELKGILRDLVYQQESSATSMGILQALALHEPWEKKNHSDHAVTQLFCECFVHWYYEFPMSFQDREQWIRQMLKSGEAKQVRLAARAIVIATQPPYSLTSYTPNAVRLGPAPEKRLWGDVFQYLDHLIELRFELTQAHDVLVAEFSQEGFAGSFEALRDLTPDYTVKHLEKFTAWASQGKINADMRDLGGVIHRLLEHYTKQSQDPKQSEYADKWRDILERVEALRKRLDEGPFILRLQLALGREHSVAWEEINGKRVYSWEKRCQSMAKEAVSKPDLMNGEAWNIVRDPKSYHAHIFVLALGGLDANQAFLKYLEGRVGDGLGNHIFGLYLAGLQGISPAIVDSYLNELMQNTSFPKSAIIDAMKLSVATPGNRLRLLTILDKKSVEPSAIVSMFLSGSWLKDVPLSEIQIILEFIATGPKEWPKWIVQVVSNYLHFVTALPKELIPVALGALQNANSNDMDLDWHRGQVAIGIARTDLNQAFDLLANDIRRMANADRWERESMLNIFHRHGSQDFWQFICVNYPERTCRELLALEEYISKIGKLALAFDLEKNLALMLQIASESEKNAVFFAKAVLGVQKGFFPFAYAMMDIFPASANVRSALALAAVYQTGNGFDGNYSQALSTVESEITNPKTPAHHIAWLNELKHKMEQIPPRFRFGWKEKDESLDWH